MKHRTTALCALTVLAAVGCSDADIGTEESYMIESSAPVSGSTIASPSVDPNKMYWGSRKIAELSALGYLDPVDEHVARRADGIIGLLRANGQLGVTELAKLETEYLDTLFPEEQAAISKLWSILVIDDASEFSATDAVTVAVEDDYDVTSFSLAIDQLTAEVQPTARRIQLSSDLDGNVDTISGAEVASAYERRDAYLVTEVADFKSINREIAEAAPQLDSSVQRVLVTPAQAAPVLDLPSIKMICATQVHERSWRSTEPDKLPSLRLQYTLSTVGVGTDVSVLALNKTSGTTQFLFADTVLHESATTHRIEVWQNGTRIEQYDVAAPLAQEEPIPFAYDLTIDEGPAGLKHRVMGFVTMGNSTQSPFEGTYGSEAQSLPERVPAGSYRAAGLNDVRIDVFEPGRVNVIVQGVSEPCKPTQLLRDRVTHCTTPSGSTTIVFNEELATDSPDFGVLRINGEASPLYPF